MNRNETINEVLKYLRSIEKTTANQYALQENIIFFEKIRNFFSYFKWLFFIAPKIDSSRLWELSDFENSSQWEEALQRELIMMEKKKFPGLITPLRDWMVKFIISNNPTILMDLGSGGMEIELQIIKELKNKNYSRKLIFVGVDRSNVARKIAIENLSEITSEIEIREIDHMDKNMLQRIKSENRQRHLVIICKNDIFNLQNDFGKDEVSIIFYSKFKHHLEEKVKPSFEKIVADVAPIIVEFDDYHGQPHFISQSMGTWSFPVLMNGAIFSRFRDKTKRQLLDKKPKNADLTFFGGGSYLLVSKSSLKI